MSLISAISWLDDLIITAAQFIQKQQYPFIRGSQKPTLSQKFSSQEQFVQVTNVNKNHWIGLFTIGCQRACVRLFGSNGDKEIPKSTLKLISDLLQEQEKLLIHTSSKYSIKGWWYVAFEVNDGSKTRAYVIRNRHNDIMPQMC